MLQRGDGVIINMSSVASSIKGVPNRWRLQPDQGGGHRAHEVDRGGLHRDRGIRCHAICPGTVDSPSLHTRLGATGNYEKALHDFIARQPIGRLGLAEEIADLVVYLCGATYTTGQAQIIDGGWAL